MVWLKERFHWPIWGEIPPGATAAAAAFTMALCTPAHGALGSDTAAVEPAACCENVNGCVCETPPEVCSHPSGLGAGRFVANAFRAQAETECDGGDQTKSAGHIKSEKKEE